jgi:hypothetical protein
METPAYVVSGGMMTLVVLCLLSSPTTALRTFITDRHENAVVGILMRRIQEHENIRIQIRLLNNYFVLIHGVQLPIIMISMRLNNCKSEELAIVHLQRENPCS